MRSVMASPLGDVAHHGGAALGREARDPDLLLDAPLVENAELFLDLVLDGQPVRIPARRPRAVEAPHRLVARIEVLEGPREHVVDARPPVGRRRPFVKHEFRARTALGHYSAEDVLAAPKLENPFLELGPVIAGGNRFEHGPS
jgi:hypothetical protein